MTISSVLRVPVIWTSFAVASQALDPLRITEPSRLRKNSSGRPSLAVSQLCSVLFTGCPLKINNSPSFGIDCLFFCWFKGRREEIYVHYLVETVLSPQTSSQWIVTSRQDYFEWFSSQWVSAVKIPCELPWISPQEVWTFVVLNFFDWEVY